MADAARELIRLAMERFGNLWPAEAKMLRAAAEGTVADVADREGDEKLTRESEWGCWEKWGEHRKIRAEVLRWVLVDEAAAGLVHEHGIDVSCAQVTGLLDLNGAMVRHLLILARCALPGVIDLMRANLRHMNLGGSFLLGLVADSVEVADSILLRDGAVVKTCIRLNGAKVGGSLECDGSTIRGESGNDFSGECAIEADGIDVRGNVFLRDRFVAIGEVRVIGAKIGGQCACDGSFFFNSPSRENSNGCAISADTIRVAGGLLLRNGMHACGEVRILGATIGGQLSCTNSTFWNPLGIRHSSGIALNADKVNVEGSVFLHDGMIAIGQVRFVGASIGGDFACDGSTFREVDLLRSRAGCAVCTDGARIQGSVSLRSGASIKGEFRLLNSKIGGILSCMGSSVECLPGESANKGVALNAEGIEVGAVFLRREPWRGGQSMRIVGLTSLAVAKVRSDMQLQGFHCNGSVVVDRTTVEQTLQLDDQTSVKGSLDLSDARVARIHDSKGAWTDCTCVNLNGFRYGSFTDECSMTVQDRIEWIRRGMKNAVGEVVYSPQPYQQLARVLANMGREQDAAKVRVAQFCARREHERPQGLRPLHGWAIWMWRGLVYWTLEYGYARARPLAIMIVLWLLSAAVFSYAGRHEMMVPASDQVLTSREYWESRAIPPDYQAFNALVYAADSMLPIIDLHQERFWLPSPQATWLRAWLWTHIVLGWMFSTLLAVGMSGLLRDEDEEATASDS